MRLLLRQPIDFYVILPYNACQSLKSRKVDMHQTDEIVNLLNRPIDNDMVDRVDMIITLINSVPTFTKLELRYHKLESAESVAILSEVLKRNPGIQCLDLWCNDLREDGIKSLAQALTVNTQLVDINLSNNNIGDDGVITLKEVFAHNRSIKSINLSDNAISSLGIERLDQYLQQNSAIESVDLKHNQEPLNSKRYLNNIRKLCERNKLINSLGPSLTMSFFVAFRHDTDPTLSQLPSETWDKIIRGTLDKELATSLKFRSFNNLIGTLLNQIKSVDPDLTSFFKR